MAAIEILIQTRSPSGLIGPLEEMKRTLHCKDTEEALMTSYNNSNKKSMDNPIRNPGKSNFYGRGRSARSCGLKKQEAYNFCVFTGHWEEECLKKIESLIKGLQIKYANIKKRMHYICKLCKKCES